MKPNLAASPLPPPPSLSIASGVSPANGAALIDELYAALLARAAAEEPLHRLGEDRPKFVALNTARQKAVEARAAVDAIFFPQGRGDIPARRDADSRRAAAIDTLASAERARVRLVAEGAGDAALDEAEAAVKSAARTVEREIAAAVELDERARVAKEAALVAACDEFLPSNRAELTDFASDLRAILGRAKKLRWVYDYVNSTGAVPMECLPYPNDEFILVPIVIEGFLKDVEKAIWLHDQLAAKQKPSA